MESYLRDIVRYHSLHGGKLYSQRGNVLNYLRLSSVGALIRTY